MFSCQRDIHLKMRVPSASCNNNRSKVKVITAQTKEFDSMKEFMEVILEFFLLSVSTKSIINCYLISFAVIGPDPAVDACI